MTGPEHYKLAEDLLREATRDPRSVRPDFNRRTSERLYFHPGKDEREQMITLAQVHATLAVAAATALGSSTQWQDVTAKPG
jgi:hypothetical protein